MFHVSQEYPPHYGVFSIMEYVHHFKLWSSNIDIIVLYWALSSVCFVNTTSPSMNISMFNNIDPSSYLHSKIEKKGKRCLASLLGKTDPIRGRRLHCVLGNLPTSPKVLPNYFIIWTNTFYYMDKYSFQFGQMHFEKFINQGWWAALLCVVEIGGKCSQIIW